MRGTFLDMLFCERKRPVCGGGSSQRIESAIFPPLCRPSSRSARASLPEFAGASPSSAACCCLKLGQEAARAEPWRSRGGRARLADLLLLPLCFCLLLFFFFSTERDFDLAKLALPFPHATSRVARGRPRSADSHRQPSDAHGPLPDWRKGIPRLSKGERGGAKGRRWNSFFPLHLSTRPPFSPLALFPFAFSPRRRFFL